MSNKAGFLDKQVRPVIIVWGITCLIYAWNSGFSWIGMEPSWIYRLLGLQGLPASSLNYAISFTLAIGVVLGIQRLAAGSRPLGGIKECFLLWGTSYVVATAFLQMTMQVLLVNMLLPMIYAASNTPVPAFGLWMGRAYVMLFILLHALAVLLVFKDLVLKPRWACYVVNLLVAIMLLATPWFIDGGL